MTPDPWAFQRWAFEVRVGSPARKAVLSMLSSMADVTTGRCEAKQETLAIGCEVSERTVREHLSGLEAAGFIARRRQHRIDGSRRGDEFLLLAPWVIEWPDGVRIQAASSAGRPSGDQQQSLPANRRESIRTHRSGQERPERTTTENAHSTARASSDEWPKGTSESLAEAVLVVLERTACEHGAKVITKRSLGHAMQGAPGRDFVAEAHRMASYYADGRRLRDVVAAYRNWLARADRTYERPAVAAAAALPGFATAPQQARRGGRSTPADYLALLPAARAADEAERLRGGAA